MLRAFFVSVMFAMPGDVVAQDVAVTSLSGSVNEHFDTTARVAGSRLVSVRLGTARGLAFDPSNVQVVRPVSLAGVCVRSISRDGLYWMRTYYGVEATASGKRLLIEPFTSSLDQILRSYGEGEIAIVAFSSVDASCLDQSPLVLPVLVPEGAPDRIEVLLNSGSRRISAGLDGGEQVVCVTPQNIERIVFDSICTLAVVLSDRPTQRVLQVAMDDGLTVVREDYKIFLPAHQ
ncbi:hypothetical protein GEU84_019605 [Fertoebacter nigrum]|uniref:Uncharacterized protein n=1 Tax=Fertoeibacter niger TaxID=2656921 RepID=A0A8X8H2W4_9RHOB|nr:hypothetical protein [Fertoeibacter niger]NUB46603.1 hypothetical protein [Fertoeibacter niger]